MKNKSWILQVFLWTFILSIIFSFFTNIISLNSNIVINAIIILFVIATGIIFDMIGTSCLTSKEASFHSMASKKIKGSKEAINLIRNNAKVASICNDIVGDICGIVSGGLGAVLAINISAYYDIKLSIVSIIIAAIISSLTVGGKAIFKIIAIKKANSILFSVSKIISIFKRK